MLKWKGKYPSGFGQHKLALMEKLRATTKTESCVGGKEGGEYGKSCDTKSE